MKRREFFKSTAGSILLVPFIFNRNIFSYGKIPASPVISIRDNNAVGLAYKAGSTVNSDHVIVDKVLHSSVNYLRVVRMVDTAVMKITGKNEVGKAWESLFPEGHPTRNTRIGIKLNFSYGDGRNDVENDWSKTYCPFGPKTAVTDAIVTGLARMLEGTFPVENITLIERMYSIGSKKYYPLIQGYRKVFQNKKGLYSDVQEGMYSIYWVSPRKPAELPPEAPKFIAAPDHPDKYQAPQRIFKAVYENDFLINYAIAKDHRAAGITGVMKNNFGCTDNPFGTHGRNWNDDNSPYPGTAVCVPAFQKYIQEETPFILNVLDALTTVYEGGPLSGRIFQTNTIAVSKDPVAIDAYELHIINEVRRKKGLSILGTNGKRAADGHRNAQFLSIAVERHQLGNMSLNKVKSYDLSSLPDGQPEIPAFEKMQSRISGLRKRGDHYEITVFLDDSKRKHEIEYKIEDVRGKVVKKGKPVATRSTSCHLEWDGNDEENKRVAGGIYIWYIDVDGMRYSTTIVDEPG